MICRFKLPLFGSLVLVYIGDSEKEKYAKVCESSVDEVFKGSPDGKCYGSHIWLKYPSLKTLSHEITHFADACMEHVGIEDSGGEVKAYIVGWGVETIWNKIKEK